MHNDHHGEHRGEHRGRRARFGPGFRPGGRMRRGDVRPLLIRALSDGPGHGYELITRLEAMSGGIWRPSPGSVYPTLQLLEDAGVVRSSESGGKRVYELTDLGREEAAQSGTEMPWDHDSSTPDQQALRTEVRQLQLASRQVAIAGIAENLARATALVREARQGIYRILAED
jgi:DNA-binding PadR family transcriptional regulator